MVHGQHSMQAAVQALWHELQIMLMFCLSHVHLNCRVYKSRNKLYTEADSQVSADRQWVLFWPVLFRFGPLGVSWMQVLGMQVC